MNAQLAVCLLFAATGQIQVPEWAVHSQIESVYEDANGRLQQATVKLDNGTGTYTLRDGMVGRIFNVRYSPSMNHHQAPSPTAAIIGSWEFNGRKGFVVFRAPDTSGIVNGYWGFEQGPVRGSWDGFIQVAPPLPMPSPIGVELTPEKEAIESLGKPLSAVFDALGKPETVFDKNGKAGFIPAAWLKQGADLSQSVGQLVRNDGTGVGTCFMIGEGIALTAKHIIDTHGINTTYEVRFQIIATPRFDYYKLARSPILLEPDICVLQLAKDSQLPWRRPLPIPSIKGLTEENLPQHKFKSNDAYVIGFPRNQGQNLSLNGAFKDPPLAYGYYYDANTDEGSSGAPVFDFEWNLVAMHRKGAVGMRAKYNYGQRIDHVLIKIRDTLAETPEGRSIVEDLKLGK